MGDALKLAIIDDLCKDTTLGEKEKLDVYSKKYSDLYAIYPQLFKKACEPNFDVEKLAWMLNMLENVNSNGVSKHNADVCVGERLVDEHIKPKLAN